MKKSAIFVLLGLIFLSACQAKPADQIPDIGVTNANGLQITSPSFAFGKTIPAQYTCDSGDIGKSPEIDWSHVPAAAQSLALIVDDPDANLGPFIHWVIYNIPPGLPALPEGMPVDNHIVGYGTQGKNGFNTIGYGGPCPPFGATHHYYFHLYALDLGLSLPDGLDSAQLKTTMQGHILAQVEWLGMYK